MASEILIVDDEADIRELVAGILQDEGYVTRTARDSDDALAAIAARRPNLVFLDIWLQGSRLDGLQVLDAVKREVEEETGLDVTPSRLLYVSEIVQSVRTHDLELVFLAVASGIPRLNGFVALDLLQYGDAREGRGGTQTGARAP